MVVSLHLVPPLRRTSPKPTSYDSPGPQSPWTLHPGVSPHLSRQRALSPASGALAVPSVRHAQLTAVDVHHSASVDSVAGAEEPGTNLRLGFDVEVTEQQLLPPEPHHAGVV